MAFQITGQIKVQKAYYQDLYVKVAFYGTQHDKIHLEAYGYESLAEYNAGSPPVTTKEYKDVAPSNFGALAGNVAQAMQTRAENYVKAQILAAFPTVQIT